MCSPSPAAPGKVAEGRMGCGTMMRQSGALDESCPVLAQFPICFRRPIHRASPDVLPTGADKGCGDSCYGFSMEGTPPFRQSSRKFARALRRDMTKAEALLWSALRGHRLAGHKFRRQTPIGPYFADFACLSKKIIVEADGRTHDGDEAAINDAARNAWFERNGYRVLRFADDLIIGGLPIVIERIRAALAD